MIDDVIVGLVFLEMNALDVSILWSSEFRLNTLIFLPLLVLLILGLFLVPLCNGLLLALFLAFLLHFFWQLLDVFWFEVLIPIDS